MADEAVSPSATATATTPQGDGVASQAPAPSAAPSGGAAVSTPAAPSAPAAKADAPGSPPEKSKDVRSGLMDAAKAALQKTRAGSPSAQKKGSDASATVVPPADAAAGPAASQGKTEAKPNGAASATDGQADGDKPGDAADLEDDETKPPPFNEHPRWKKLTRDFEHATATIKKLGPDADQYQKIVTYMETFDLTPDDVATAYDITAKLKHNPQLAYQALKPIWDELCMRVGETLPDDLAQRVKQGFLDDASARELARQRAATTTAANEATRQAQQATRGQQSQVHQAIQGAVARWDAQQTAKNPDFLRLRPFVEDAARSIMARDGKAKSPDEAVAVLEKAMKHVTERLQPFRAPNANGSTPRQPVAGSPSTGVAAPEPKSLREAAQLGLEGRYRAS
jgi:hypothetical protein